jgi:hypothetical protein
MKYEITNTLHFAFLYGIPSGPGVSENLTINDVSYPSNNSFVCYLDTVQGTTEVTLIPCK